MRKNNNPLSWKLCVSAAALLITLLYSATVSQCAEKNNFRMAFRYDDYSNSSDTDLEMRLLSLFEKYHIPVTIGVIPYNGMPKGKKKISLQKQYVLSREKANLLEKYIDEGIVEVAMHGYSHEATRNRSEFRGLHKKEQSRRLSEGKNILEQIFGLQLTTFIPPWGSYDSQTIKILESLNFRIISADYPDQKGHEYKISFAPASFAPHELKKKIKLARRLSLKNSLFVVVFHSYDFEDGDRHILTLMEFEKILQWVVFQKDISTHTISEAIN